MIIRVEDAQQRHPIGLVPDHLGDNAIARVGVKDDMHTCHSRREADRRGSVRGSSGGSLGGIPMYDRAVELSCV